MPLRNIPIKQKLTTVIMLTTLSALIIASILFFAIKVRTARNDLIGEVGSIAALIGANSQAALSFDDPTAGRRTLASLSEDKRILSATLFTDGGRVFATYQRAMENPQDTSVERALTPLVVKRPIFLAGKTIGALEISVDTMTGFYKRLYEYAFVTLLVLIMSALGAYFISKRLGRVISEPILNLANTAEAVSRDRDFSLRGIKTGNDEIGTLIDRFNEMLTQISMQDASLRESEHQMRLITDSLPVLISYVDSNERYDFVNRSYEEWFKKPREELKGQTVKEVVGPEAYDAVSSYLRRTLAGESTTFEASLNYSGAGTRYISATLLPDFDPETAEVRGYFSLITDISEQKRIETELKSLNEELERRVIERTAKLRESEEKLRQSERLASIGTLAAGMAHEIRNPVNSISLAAQHALRYQKDLSNPMRQSLDAIAAEAKRCGTIIKNILQFAKAESTPKSLNDLNGVIRNAIALAKAYSPLPEATIITELWPEPLFVQVNPTEIEQLMVNLINNSLEAGTNNITVKVSTKRTDSGVRIIVDDSGPGIPEKTLVQVFDPFYSTKRKHGNSGLGLSLCHGIVSQHRGTISVQSTVGKGTTFTIDFPLKPVANQFIDNVEGV